MTQNNNNRSLFLYTALIFIVAILLIIISIFGESHSSRVLPSPSPSQESAIAEKASALSAENLRLTEEVSSLKAQNAETKKQLEIYTSLSEALYHKVQGNVDSAKQIIASLDYEMLDEKQKELYNSINE